MTEGGKHDNRGNQEQTQDHLLKVLTPFAQVKTTPCADDIAWKAIAVLKLGSYLYISPKGKKCPMKICAADEVTVAFLRHLYTYRNTKEVLVVYAAHCCELLCSGCTTPTRPWGVYSSLLHDVLKLFHPLQARWHQTLQQVIVQQVHAGRKVVQEPWVA